MTGIALPVHGHSIDENAARAALGGGLRPSGNRAERHQDERQQEAYHQVSLRLCAGVTSSAGRTRCACTSFRSSSSSPSQPPRPRRRRFPCPSSFTSGEPSRRSPAADGSAVSWLPQSGQSDLPCFVEHTGYCVKCEMWGRVRMETPVLYFYAPRQVNVDVKVGFKQGIITEWYPRALVDSNAPAGRGRSRDDRLA